VQILDAFFFQREGARHADGLALELEEIEEDDGKRVSTNKKEATATKENGMWYVS